MCSSPKSSGPSISKVRLKGFYEEMGSQQRKRFTEVANRADERREQRLELKKRWQAKQQAPVRPTGVFSWLNKMIRNY